MEKNESLDKQIEIIERAIFEFEESGRASRTALARFIIGKLNDSGYEINELSQDNSDSEQIICPACDGTEYSETDKVYECAYTDCATKWAKSFL